MFLRLLTGRDKQKVHLFLESGVPEEVDAIRECLDTGIPLDDFTGSAYSMGETLIRFLESLVEPVIPFSMYNRCIEASGSFSECKQLLSYLSTVNYNVFFYLMAFLREVLNCSAKNRLAPNKLGLHPFPLLSPSSPSRSLFVFLLTIYRIASHRIASHRIASHRIASHRSRRVFDGVDQASHFRFQRDDAQEKGQSRLYRLLSSSRRRVASPTVIRWIVALV